MREFFVWFVFCLMSTSGITLLFLKLNNIKKVHYIFLLIFIVGVSIITFLKYFDIKYYTLLTYFVFYPILFRSIQKLSLKSIIVHTLIIGLIGVILDLISMLISSGICLIFDISLEEYYKIFSIGLSIIMFFIFLWIGFCSKTRNLLIKIIKFFCEIQYLNFSLVIFCIFICILAISIFFNLNRIKLDLLIFIIVILSGLIFMLLIKFKIDNFENKKYLETLKENNDFYIKIDDENRIFKHNLMAKLASIKSVSNKKAISLIDDFVIKTNKNISYSKKIKHIPYGLNGIIYQKTYPYLEKVNFKLNNKINFDIFKILSPRRYNVLIEKLVVSLDNAIEASLNSKNKVVVINLYDDEENIYVEIKNSFAHNLDIDDLGSLNYSTKDKKRGLGLFSILRDNEASVNIKVVNNYFISVLSARKQK